MTREENFMMEAIALSGKALKTKEGGPFGCVVVKNNEIIARGNNRVIADNDPTAHAEVIAIRNACKALGTFQLNGCEVYTSCEPCPMCLGAIYWARPLVVYYANTHTDAADIGFDDSMIYDEILLGNADKKIPLIHLANESALKVFKEWIKDTGNALY